MATASEIQKLLDIFPFRHQYLNLAQKKIDAIKLHYVDEGQGKPILFVHGNPTWSFYFRGLIQKFKSSHRVVALDHIGSGLSSKPMHYSYRLEDHIANLDILVSQLKLRDITLVVHDWGGPIGLGWATRNPDLVKRIVILNTAAFRSMDLPKRIGICRIPIIGEFLVRRLNMFAGLAPLMATSKGLSPEVKQAYLLPYGNYADRIGIARFVQDIPLSPNHPSYRTLEDIEKALQSLKCPKLILWGEKDFCFHPGFRRKWQDIFPEAKVKAIADAGHLVLEDAPDECAKIIGEFLLKE